MHQVAQQERETNKKEGNNVVNVYAKSMLLVVKTSWKEKLWLTKSEMDWHCISITFIIYRANYQDESESSNVDSCLK